MELIKKDSAYFIYKTELEDIGFLEKIKVHISYEKPPHRYEGNLNLYPNKLIFSGTDIRDERDYFLEIAREDLININIGFDDTYKESFDRLAGNGFQPIRLEFREKDIITQAYLIIEFDRLEQRRYKNEDWYQVLSEWHNS